MTPLQQFWHLANFLAPALLTAAIAAALVKWLWRRELANVSWFGLTFWAALAGEAAMIGGWMLVGRDGATATYAAMVLAVALAWLLAGWKGAAIAIGAIALEQTLGEASKNIAQRPRPSRDLIAVVGNPSGFSFPSMFTTFMAVTFGTVMMLARRSRARTAPFVMGVAGLMIVVGWGARVALGAHWPSDVVLTTVVCLAWVWAAIRAVRP